MENEENIIAQPQQPQVEEETMGLQEILALCLARWQWFLASVALCVGLAAIYLLRTPPTYTRSTAVLIKDDAAGKSGIASGDNSFADMGLFSMKTNVDNELVFMQSPATVLETVRRLHLDMHYSTDGAFHRETLYGRTLPVAVSVAGLGDNDACSLTVELGEEGRVTLSDMTLRGEKASGESEGRLGRPIATPIGRVTVAATPYYASSEARTIYVSRTGSVASVTACQGRLSAEIDGKKTTIINLSYQDVSTQRAEDFLNTLIAVYNESWVKDKNQIAVSTSRFIDERLQVIEHELGNVDNSISSYKSEHLIPDVAAVSAMYMSNANEANQQVMALSNQLYMARYIRALVGAESSRYELLPANSGIGSTTIEKQIADYNDKVLQRNSLVANSSAGNPLVRDLDASLAAMRGAILSSVDNEISSLDKQVAAFQGRERQNTSRIASNPTQAKYLLSVERQQKVKESLYLYLLQKREENELSQAFTAYNTRVVTPPTGPLAPTSPVRAKILLIALALGLLLPAALIYLRETTNTKLRGRKDLERLSVPLLGEIPLHGASRRRWEPRKWLEALRQRGKKEARQGDDDELKPIVVEEGNRDIINEAFRVLRSNIDFVTGKDRGHNVFTVTSFNPGSGKSFITMNLAVSFAIKRRRVLVVDGDLRHGSSSAYVGSPRKGLSDYLCGRTDDWQGAIVRSRLHECLDVMPIGTIPPNPTELLEEERLATLIGQLRGMYDYIFVDCPPIDIVADTQIVEKLTDRTVFVVRSGLLERSMLPELESIYTTRRFKNFAVVLNGTENSGGRYSYRYGYHHGHYYGYHSYYGSQKNGE